MNAPLLRLRAEVENDREAVNRWLDEVADLVLGPDSDRATRARAAWALHHAYSAVEAILNRVMRVIEGSVPEGPDFHRGLLDVAGLDIEGIRPPLLRLETISGLHDLRAFRHFVRHAYAVELDGERLRDLQQRASSLRAGLEDDLQELLAWLDDVATAAGLD